MNDTFENNQKVLAVSIKPLAKQAFPLAPVLPTQRQVSPALLVPAVHTEILEVDRREAEQRLKREKKREQQRQMERMRQSQQATFTVD